MTIDTALGAATDLIADFEGFIGHPYRDSGGVWTIGYGATYLLDGRPVTGETPPVTEAEARALLTTMVARTLSVVRRLVAVPITDDQAAALTSFTYNLGVTSLAKSTLLKDLNAGNYDAAAAQFGVWVHDDGKVLDGLVRRRAAESALFLSNVPAPPPHEIAAELMTESPSSDDLNANELNQIQGTPT